MTKRDLHQEITDRIADAIEAGARPWAQDWSSTGGGGFPIRATGEQYRGINVLLLWLAAEVRGYRAAQWMTFKQAQKLGGCVRKGEKGTGVVYFSTFEKEREDGSAEKIPFLKSYTVFNVEQIDGLPESYEPEAVADYGTRTDPEIDAFFAATGAEIVNSGRDPVYIPSQDRIEMPAPAQFVDQAAYYGTLAHELIHWTGAPDRLNRDKNYQKIEGRAFEELIAEIGGCFLASHLGVTPDLDNSAGYVANWLTALRSDKRWIFKAATAAQAASDYARELAEGATETAPAPAPVAAPAAAPAAVQRRSELTQAGEQYVLDGCAHQARSTAPVQLDLFA